MLKLSLNFIKDAINLAITTQHIPSELLCIGLLLPLPKVGSPNNITQYRPIVVLSTIYRLFSTIINSQFMLILEEANIIHPAQRGFMKKGSTIDHIITLRSVMSSHIQHKQPLFSMALDISKCIWVC